MRKQFGGLEQALKLSSSSRVAMILHFVQNEEKL